MSSINSTKLIIAHALYAFAGNLTAKLLTLKLISQSFGSDYAKAIAATDATISAYSETIVNGLNSDTFEAAIKDALTVSGLTEDQVVEKAEEAINTAIDKLGDKIGLDTTVEALIIAIAEPEIEKLLRAEYAKVTSQPAAS